MPLVGFRPTKARLIIEDSKASILVMKVVVQPGDSVRLATGDKLEELNGVLRIRSKDNGSRNGANDLGSLVYIAESDAAADSASYPESRDKIAANLKTKLDALRN